MAAQGKDAFLPVIGVIFSVHSFRTIFLLRRLSLRRSSRSLCLFCISLSLTACGTSRPSPSGASTSTPPTTGASQHEVDLQWTPSPSDVAGYRVYRGTQHNGPYSLLTSTLVTGTSYTDLQVSAGETAFYVVTAVNADGVESDYSPEAQATVPAP